MQMPPNKTKTNKKKVISLYVLQLKVVLREMFTEAGMFTQLPPTDFVTLHKQLVAQR